MCAPVSSSSWAYGILCDMSWMMVMVGFMGHTWKDADVFFYFIFKSAFIFRNSSTKGEQDAVGRTHKLREGGEEGEVEHTGV